MRLPTFNARSLRKRILYGPTLYPQQMHLGLQNPQSKVDVWLHGLEKPILVTNNHIIACCAPLTFCIAFQPEDAARFFPSKLLSLRFEARSRPGQSLGEITLRIASTFRRESQTFVLFHATHSNNHTLPMLRLWAHHRLYAKSFRPEKNLDVPVSTLDAQAMAVYFICPRPIVLAAVAEGEGGNMFPMNLMGPLGKDYFGFALNSHRLAAPLVDRVRRITLSNVPIEQAAVVIALGANHKKSGIAWNELPFPALHLPGIATPVPAFATHVREMAIQSAHPIGSHTLFIAKTTAELHIAHRFDMFSAHGFYQAWQDRVRPKSTNDPRSIAE